MAEGWRATAAAAGFGRAAAAAGRAARRYRRSGHRAFAQGRGAAGTEELVEFTGGQHQQEPFADRLGATALGAIEFAGGEGAKLLRHLTSRLCACSRISLISTNGIMTSSEAWPRCTCKWRSLAAMRLIRWPIYSPRDDLITSTMSRSASRRTTPKKPGNFVSMKRRLKVNWPRWKVTVWRYGRLLLSPLELPHFHVVRGRRARQPQARRVLRSVRLHRIDRVGRRAFGGGLRRGRPRSLRPAPSGWAGTGR